MLAESILLFKTYWFAAIVQCNTTFYEFNYTISLFEVLLKSDSYHNLALVCDPPHHFISIHIQRLCLSNLLVDGPQLLFDPTSRRLH